MILFSDCLLNEIFYLGVETRRHRCPFSQQFLFPLQDLGIYSLQHVHVLLLITTAVFSNCERSFQVLFCHFEIAPVFQIETIAMCV